MTSHRDYYARALAVRLNGKEQQNVRCPLHSDRRASLSINLTTGAWKCHGGCGAGGRRDFEARLASSGEQPKEVPRSVKVGLRRQTEAVYDYCDASGKILFRKTRSSCKQFVLHRKLNGDDNWALGLEGLDARPLYNLPALIAAKYVAFTEGEKDADRLNALFKRARMKDWAATTNFDGANGNWREEYKEPLRGKHVVILPDNDAPGRLHGEMVARGAASVAASVGVLALPDLPEKGDVSDYLDTHKDSECLAQLKATKPWQDPVQSLFLTAAELAAEMPEKTDWIVTGLLASGSCSQLMAKLKFGKSTFTQYMIRAVLDGTPFLERKTQKGPVVYLTEMPTQDLLAELKTAKIAAHPDLHILLYHRAMKLSWPEAVDAAIVKAKKFGARFLVVDTFSKWTRIKDENSSSETLACFEPIDRALAAGLGVWIESHERKSGGDIADAGRGSSALGGAVSIIVNLRKPEGKHPPSYRAIEVIGRHGIFQNVLNWTAEEYLLLGTKNAVAMDLASVELRAHMPTNEKDALPFKEILGLAKKENPQLSRTTAQRVLEQWVGHGIAVRLGASTKKDPFRFYIRAEDTARKPKF
jgi:AAA domain